MARIGEFDPTLTKRDAFDAAYTIDGWLDVTSVNRPITSTVASGINPLTTASAGSELVSGSVASALNSFTTASAGSELVSGAADSYINPFTTSASCSELVSGTAANSLNPFTTAATGSEAVSATASSDINAVTTDASGSEATTGSAGSDLASFTTDATGDVVGSQAKGDGNPWMLKRWLHEEEMRKRRKAEYEWAALQVAASEREIAWAAEHVNNFAGKVSGTVDLYAGQKDTKVMGNGLNPHRRFIKGGEALCIMREAIHSEGNAMWWDGGLSVPPNETIGDLAVVHIIGSLEHRMSSDGDSYESIIERVQCAIDGEDGIAPKFVVLRIDSPGGVCSGLNQTVFKLQRMSAESGVPLVAYVDELCASAAYALACACEEIVLPPSGVAGSVGVISSMGDQVEANKRAGFNIVTITSGDRKADGHPDVSISDEAIEAEKARVDELASQFFSIVSEARGLSLATVEGFQAGIYLGQDAVKAGLASDIQSWDELIESLSTGASDLRASKTTAKGTDMHATLSKLIKKCKASLASETDAKKKKELASTLATYSAALSAYSKEKKTVETKTVETSEADDSEDEAAEGNETDRKEEFPAKDDGGEDKDDDGDEEDDDEESASASIAAIARQATGKSGRAAAGALAALIAAGQRATEMVEKISRERMSEKKALRIDNALATHRVTKAEANTLRGKPMSFVESFLDMRPKAMVNTEDGALRMPDENAKVGDGSTLSESTMRSIEATLGAAPQGVDKKKLREQLIAQHEKRVATSTGGRY